MELQNLPLCSYAKMVGEEGQRDSVVSLMGTWARFVLSQKKALSRDWV